MPTANLNEITGKLEVTSDITGGKQEFTRIICAVSFGKASAGDPDLRKHAAVVSGEMSSGMYTTLAETSSDYASEFFDSVVDLRDMLLPDWIYGPPEPLLIDLQNHDGLMGYKVKAIDARGGPIYEEQDPHNRWKHFRGWTTYSIVSKIPVGWADDLQSWMGKVDSMAKQGKVLLADKWTPVAAKAISLGHGLVLDQPIARAYLLSIAMLEFWNQGTGYQPPPQDEIPENWGGYL